MKKFGRFAILALALLGMSARADHVIHCYYTLYSVSNGQTPDSVGKGVSDGGQVTKPGGGTVALGVTVTTGNSQEFVAHPPTGWKVKYWYKIPYENGIAAVKSKNGTGSTYLAGATDSYTWKADVTAGEYILTVFFEPISYRLAFDADGGSGVPQKDLKYDEQYQLPSTSKKGYAFSAWRTTGGQQFAASSTVSGESFGVTAENERESLTALWSEKSYGVTSRGVNCSVTVSSSSSLYTGNLTITAPAPAPVSGSTWRGTAYVYPGTDDSQFSIAQFPLDGSPTCTFNMSTMCASVASIGPFICLKMRSAKRTAFV